MVLAVVQAQDGVHVPQAQVMTLLVRTGFPETAQAFLRHAAAIVLHCDLQLLAAHSGTDLDAPAAVSETVYDGVFHNGLEHQLGY